MSAKKYEYINTFGLFLLLSGCGGAVISLINRYLRANEMVSPTSTYILWFCLTAYFFLICRWMFRKLNSIEKA